MDEDGPQILRPVPRRPFNADLTDVTPPEDNVADHHDRPSLSSNQSGLDLSSPRFLNADFDRTESTSSLSRPQSFLNLNSSTLMGIYSEASSHTRDYLVNDNEESDTPWGTGARTPIRRPGIDEATYKLMHDRSHVPRREVDFGSYAKAEDVGSPRSSFEHTISLALRGSLLFALGLGYGVLVTRLHNEQSHLPPFPDGSLMKPGNNWRYLAFWGAAGVVLGSLLPWFDTVWAKAFKGYSESAMTEKNKDAGPGTDWPLVMRAVGAFVGIIFAIRKLAWVSTLQVSATLALVNPLLWWLIDRSKSGFVLSAAVGLTGSMFLLGMNPQVMAAPSGLPSRNTSMGIENESLALGGLANQETVETGIYMLSVLFCSCICFGNIGRGLTWNRSSGRWGGVR
ncbi:hypothetical protein EsDP_00004146 [Epichloe bromicola]|uniref:INSIG domain-containing protein n=1 Tax=Epichloe bromicola TaxID=79588 RepID=A0ABQ0CQU5_9HYPO